MIIRLKCDLLSFGASVSLLMGRATYRVTLHDPVNWLQCINLVYVWVYLSFLGL